MKKVFWIIICLCQIFLLRGQDIDPPEAPELTRVSVDPATGFSALWWSPSPSTDVAGYIIYRYIDDEGFALDTLYKPEADYYLYTKTPATYFSLDYVVAALDTAGNVSPLSNPLNTLFLEAELDTCGNAIILDWNEYSGWDPPIEYAVISSLNQSDYSEIHRQQDTVWTLNSFATDAGYCFYIRAFRSPEDTVSSNRICLATDMLRPPAWIRGRSSSLQDGRIQLLFTPEPGSELSDFDLYQYPFYGESNGRVERRYSWSGSGDLQIELSPGEISGPQLFRLAAVNTCGRVATWSDSLSTLFLGGQIKEENIAVSWNPLLSHSESPGSYLIFRRIGNNSSWQLAATADAADTIVHDALSDLIFNPSGHHVYYYLRWQEEAGTSYPSESNIISLELPVRVYVPNAFTPDGNLRNQTFRPVLSFTPASYELSIRNRSGTELFHSQEPQEAWDGQYRGKLQPEGMYIWHLKITTLEGSDLEQTGQVSILIPGR